MEDLQVLIRQIWRETGKTVVMVTHDIEEAVFLGQRVVVLASDPGRIAADVPVQLRDDRDLEVKRRPEFLALKSSIEDLVRTYRRSNVGP
jgi:NitT/TauT family transport system ATP-binding protein